MSLSTLTDHAAKRQPPPGRPARSASRPPFPDGTDDLELDVRILTVCDVYDALVSERVYRAAMPEHEALAILDAERGTAFDPGCVDALRALLDSSALAAA